MWFNSLQNWSSNFVDNVSMHLASVDYFLPQSQENIFSFRSKNTKILYGNLDACQLPHFGLFL